MTARVTAAPPLRAVRDTLLPGLASVVTPHLVATGWALLASAVRGPALRVAMFADPTASRPAGVALSAALVDPASLRPPVLLLLIAASALGFRLGARR